MNIFRYLGSTVWIRTGPLESLILHGKIQHINSRLYVWLLRISRNNFITPLKGNLAN